jgi:argininosuccinate synthase
VLGRSSPDTLYSDEYASFDSTTVDQCDAVGFSKYYGLQARLLMNQKRD